MRRDAQAPAGALACAVDWDALPGHQPEREAPGLHPGLQESDPSLGGAYTICVGDVGNPGEPANRFGVPKRRPSEFLDGYGLGILRSGQGQNQRDATLFYGGVRGHAHYDPLMLGLHGFGRDLLPNIGYPQSWNFAHAWEWSLFTHNTVVVDRDESPCSTVVGSLTVWAAKGGRRPGHGGLQTPYRVQEPRGEKGPDVTDYRRMVVLVDLGPVRLVRRRHLPRDRRPRSPAELARRLYAHPVVSRA